MQRSWVATQALPVQLNLQLAGSAPCACTDPGDRELGVFSVCHSLCCDAIRFLEHLARSACRALLHAPFEERLCAAVAGATQ